jgi:hypothetical protein
MLFLPTHCYCSGSVVDTNTSYCYDLRNVVHFTDAFVTARCLLQLQNLNGSHETYQLRLQVSMLTVHTFILKRSLTFLAVHV